MVIFKSTLEYLEDGATYNLAWVDLFGQLPTQTLVLSSEDDEVTNQKSSIRKH
ncbi:MAG: hypothetical protein HLUCCO02_09690 [Idiomarinaceae bacterium HL-53]|nr:MAG: hypothetical protein HLUCCO02_09690 [Idiomarinaceae bacterium HL-53]